MVCNGNKTTLKHTWCYRPSSEIDFQRAHKSIGWSFKNCNILMSVIFSNALKAPIVVRLNILRLINGTFYFFKRMNGTFCFFGKINGIF